MAPIFEKELRVAARRKRTYLLRTIYLGLLTVTVAVAWRAAVDTMQLNPARALMEVGQLAPKLLATCGWFQLIGLTLLGPVLTSTAISEEQSRRTLGVLLTTPLTAGQIVTGMLLSRSLQLLLLVALTLPVMALVQVYGGVETSDVIGVVCLSLANGLFAAAVGLCVSTLSIRPNLAIPASYLALLGAYLLPFFTCCTCGGPFLLSVSNPFVTMGLLHVEMMDPEQRQVAG